MTQPNECTKKYEWSESGMELLQTIENSIAKSGGSLRLAKLIEHERHSNYNCVKRSCFYCEQFKRLLELEMPPIMVEVTKHPIKRVQQTYTVRKHKAFCKLFSNIEG